MKKTLTALTLAAALSGFAGAALASESHANIDAPRDQWMSTDQISQKLTAEGYKVRRVKEEGGAYEVYALDAKGNRVEAIVNPVTGQILGNDQDD
ncbi:PepSY domain-containing protein [Roseibium aggregatum]|uniref:PepSY domain-containing protein n=1 Tax=Roseibium aggregatum TaxID=187304 RepID=A0A926NW44_9HYPH|nr:PepSY domain-containing protein [Roseibium aggregatum]MBD1545205.1 PepSY domain-containing protein [Roseibium aggregatum]